MPAMFIFNKDDLAKKVKEENGCGSKDMKAIITDIFASISKSLEEGNEVSIYGFGKFEVKTRAARTGLNPQTKEKIQIEETKTVSFKPSKQLKEFINE